MNNRRKISIRSRASKKLSNVALANYLVSLADVNDLPDTGNPVLASALRSLARAVRQKSIRIEDPASPIAPKENRRTPQLTKQTKKTKPLKDRSDSENLSKLTSKQIRDFINDESKTKEELLRLASSRFSMPLSQLRRSTIAEVKQAILSALLHENSMDILSQEAEREGKARSS
ncbi:hypothetical protein ACFSHT_07175 [Paraburkholderia silviterrae]|uniref:Uncharacterized protein n=1 Tax=Paraburkholderia silviterrae TaxID=2528715 RepID=A0A4V2ZZC4_9BURK|nr:hypothetical protein [Paraburkholderia silviterrae]TDG24671.1 hypothetical protein EYW47_08970 [Paraburkholderia silviterrae]